MFGTFINQVPAKRRGGSPNSWAANIGPLTGKWGQPLLLEMKYKIYAKRGSGYKISN